MRFVICRCAAVPLFVASAGSALFAGDPATVSEDPRTDAHKELLSEFRYVKTPADPSPNAPILSNAGTDQRSATPAPDNSVPVMMAPFTVREVARMDTLHEDILKQDADARAAKITSRLGIGIHTGPMGFYAITIFYIPITVGFGTPIMKPK
jgi:hypothetical protein